MKPLKRLDPTWWREAPNGYDQRATEPALIAWALAALLLVLATIAIGGPA